jgi:hypothetical protein
MMRMAMGSMNRDLYIVVKVASVGGRSVTRLLHKRRRNENVLAFVEDVPEDLTQTAGTFITSIRGNCFYTNEPKGGAHGR